MPVMMPLRFIFCSEVSVSLLVNTAVVTPTAAPAAVNKTKFTTFCHGGTSIFLCFLQVTNLWAPVF